jgi:hypothetical protein
MAYANAHGKLRPWWLAFRRSDGAFVHKLRHPSIGQGHVSAYVMQAYMTFSDQAKKNVSRGRTV